MLQNRDINLAFLLKGTFFFYDSKID